MARTRSAVGQRADTPRRRGQHSAETPSVDQVERRGDAAHRGVSETTDGLQLLFNQASRYPLLTREEEVELAKRIERGDLEAKERLINSNLRLVIKFARRYQGHGLSLQDLVQEAMLGLIRAAEKFDWRRGYKFSTYAVLWIKQAIQRGLDNTGRPVRIPAHVAQRERTVNRTETELSMQLNRDPTDEEIAGRAKLPLDEVKAIRDLTRVTTSLDAPVGEGDTSLGELRTDSVPASRTRFSSASRRPRLGLRSPRCRRTSGESSSFASAPARSPRLRCARSHVGSGSHRSALASSRRRRFAGSRPTTRLPPGATLPSPRPGVGPAAAT